MNELTTGIVRFAHTYLGDVVQIGTPQDLWYYAIGIVVIVLIMMAIAYYTLKRVVMHLITGYIALYIAQFLGVHIEPDAIMITLMALFGPIPVVLMAAWQWFF